MKTIARRSTHTNKYTDFTGLAFAGCDVIRQHDVMVTEDGSVLVWDSVANAYTTCHSISAVDQDQIRKSVG